MMVACTWLLAFSALIPTWGGFWGMFGLDHSIGSCSILKDKNGKELENGSPPDEYMLNLYFTITLLLLLLQETRQRNFCSLSRSPCHASAFSCATPGYSTLYAVLPFGRVSRPSGRAFPTAPLTVLKIATTRTAVPRRRITSLQRLICR